MTDLPADLREQVDKGLITRREAENIANGLNPNGTKKTPHPKREGGRDGH